VVENKDGNIISSLGDAEIGEEITVRLSDGELRATVSDKIAKDKQKG
jgi:exonuclease VII large subunit